MAVTLAVRGDSYTARYSDGNPIPAHFNGDSYHTITADSNAIGSNVIKITGSATSTGIFYDGGKNFPDGGSFSMMIRYQPNYVGNPGFHMTSFSLNDVGPFHIGTGHLTNDALYGYVNTYQYKPVITGTNMEPGYGAAYHTTTGYTDLMVVYDDSIKRIIFYANAVNIYQVSVTGTGFDGYGREHVKNLCLGGTIANILKTDLKVDEFVVWDEVIDPTDVALENTTSASLDGTGRTSFVSASVFDGSSYTDPGIGNVLSGTGYDFAGVSLTGTYAPPGASSDPGIANVLSATSYIINGSTLTGTYNPPVSTDPGIGNVLSATGYTINDASLTGTYNPVSNSTDPGIANVALSTEYIINGSTLTGTLNVPVPGSGSAGTLDMIQLKTTIKDILDVANTVGASPIDLSNGMNDRVRDIYTLNPNNLPIQPSSYPCATIFIEKKDIESTSIFKDQSSVKRRATLDISILGIVWEDNVTDNLKDEADDQCEYLMENIERVLRSNDKIRGLADWAIPDGVDYQSIALSEESHLRAGILTLKAVIHY